MSSINSVRNLQMLYFSKKNNEIKNLKNGKKKWSGTPIYTYYLASGKSPFFAIGSFCTTHSICLNIHFRQISFLFTRSTLN